MSDVPQFFNYGLLRGIHVALLRNESEISEFEVSNGIVLPTDFRSFLLSVPSGTPKKPWEFPKYGYFGFPGDDVSKPFQWTNADAEFAIQKRLHIDSDFDFEEDEEKEYNGFLTLIHYGCAWVEVIVINGEQSGMVWAGGNCLWHPCHDEDGRQLRFLEWYERIYEPYFELMKRTYG